jgi:AraC-like DNA-binding protein
MPSIPLPFIVTAVLLVLLARMLGAQRKQPLFLVFVALCALQTGLVGLRWSLDLSWVKFVQPVSAACLPPLAFAAFDGLRGRKVSARILFWPVSVVVLWFVLPVAIDAVLITEFVVFGLLIQRLKLPDTALSQIRIGDEWTVGRARYGVAILLILSALVDTIVALDLAGRAGTTAAPAIAAMMGLILVALAAALFGRAGETIVDSDVAPPPDKTQADSTPPPEEADQDILALVETALEAGLYRDHDLTLQRIARRTGITARKISHAVNRGHGTTVTDLVNGYRVREAMRLLRDSDLPVTQVMLDAGFQTKSNFNRAFRATAGQTPTAYRRSESAG